MRVVDWTSVQLLARDIRIESLKMVHAAEASHIGGSLSVADILAVLYSGIVSVDPSAPGDPQRDRVVYSKGHACSALYAVLALRGFYSLKELENFGRNGACFTTHASHHVPGVDFSTGSLGHGLPVACGLAVGARRRGESWKTFAVLSDGELDEGSNWEAILFAGHHKLSNLIATIDYNGIQSFGTVEQVLGLNSLRDKMVAFKWRVHEVDGHNVRKLSAVYQDALNEPSRPTCIIAHTTKGKGVDFMENELLWHYRSPSSELLQKAIKQIREAS